MNDTLLHALSAELGDGVISGTEIPSKFTHDWAGLPPVLPLALLRPKSVAEVSAALRLCNARGIAVVPQGGLTGLAGGAQPIAGAVVLSTERLVGIEELDPISGTVTVLAGTLLQTVQQAADEAGMIFPLDLGARGSCTIGGNLATNAGGNRVIRYGMTRDMVVSLEVVLADGTIVGETHKMFKANAGYDLKNLFIGSEGTLGVITRAVLRLQRKPLTQTIALCGCADFAAVLALLRASGSALGPGLTAFEAMWPSFYDFMLDRLPRLRRPLAERHGVYVLIESSGFDPTRDRDRFEEMLATLLEQGVIVDAAVAGSEREAAEFWAVRDAVSEYGAILGEVIAFDVSFAIPQLQAAVDRIRAALDTEFPSLITLFYGHIGDGNLHVVANMPGAAKQPSAEVGKIVYAIVADLGGCVSAEHGIGLMKKPYLKLSRSAADLGLMRQLKATLDPKGTLNPGKLFDL